VALSLGCSTGKVSDDDDDSGLNDVLDMTGDVEVTDTTGDSTIGLDCMSNLQCTGVGEVCDPATEKCVLLSDKLCVACDSDLNCGTGGTCFTNPSTQLKFCIVGCHNGTECPTGYSCSQVGEIAGKCVP